MDRLTAEAISHRGLNRLIELMNGQGILLTRWSLIRIDIGYLFAGDVRACGCISECLCVWLMQWSVCGLSASLSAFPFQKKTTALISPRLPLTSSAALSLSLSFTCQLRAKMLLIT